MAPNGLPDVDVLDVFVIDEHGELATAAPWQRPAPPRLPPTKVDSTPVQGDDVDLAGLAVPATTSPRQAGRAGVGGAPSSARRARAIGRGDVVRAISVAPGPAARILLAGAVLDTVTGLEVAAARPRVDGETMRWAVRLKTGRWRRRVAELVVHPSPSWVLTIVELRPASPRRGRRRFIRHGLRAVDALGDRLVALADGSARAEVQA